MDLENKPKFGSKFKQRKHDEYHAASMGKGTDKPGMEMGKESPDADTTQRDVNEKPEMTAENPREVVKAHGPAHTVTVHHNHAEKKHKVISHHDDGHMNESEHGSAKEAHDHGSALAEEAQESPETQMSEENLGGETMSSMGQPHLA